MLGYNKALSTIKAVERRSVFVVMEPFFSLFFLQPISGSSNYILVGASHEIMWKLKCSGKKLLSHEMKGQGFRVWPVCWGYNRDVDRIVKKGVFLKFAGKDKFVRS